MESNPDFEPSNENQGGPYVRRNQNAGLRNIDKDFKKISGIQPQYRPPVRTDVANGIQFCIKPFDTI